MDLGIKGKKAIVCAASKGLGRGVAEALAADGVDLVICARTKNEIDTTAADIAAKYGVSVTPVACDITTEEGRAAVLAACPEPDILVNNAGGPPPGDFRDFNSDDWRKAVEGNMITPIALIHATVYGMMERGFGRIVNITSYSVKAPIPTLELSNGARAGLTGAVAALARKVVKTASPSTTSCRDRSTPTGCATPPRPSPRRPANPSPRSRPNARRKARPGASAPRRSSARQPPSCARSTRATSPARTSCWTAAR